MTDPQMPTDPAVARSDQVFGSFTSGVLVTFVTRALMIAGAVGSSVVVARWLGAQGLGELAVINATISMSLQIASLGIPSANTYFVARDRRKLAAVWANTMIFAFAFGSLVTFFIVALAKAKPALFGGVGMNLILIAALSIPFQLLVLLGLNLLLAMDRIVAMNLLDSLSPALILINTIVVLIIMRGGLSTLVSFNTATAIVVGFLLIWTMAGVLAQQREHGQFRPDRKLFGETLRYGLKFCIPIIAGALVFRLDLLIVNHVRGAAEAGVYAVAAQVANLLTVLPAVIATLLFPRVASYQDPGGEFAVQVTRHAAFLMFVACLAAAAGSLLLPVVYGSSFADSTIQLLILLPGVFLIGIESVLVQHFTGTGLPIIIPGFWIVTLVTNVGLNLILIPRFGARGAAIASTISYALIFALVAVYFCRKTNRKPAEIFLLRSTELRDLLRPARWPRSLRKAAS
jgi:O-antigen/teichoic acid export membrane protein